MILPDVMRPGLTVAFCGTAAGTRSAQLGAERYAPAWIAFNGKNAAKGALGRSVDYGQQPERLGPAGVFVLPSTSGAARGAWDLERWHELARIV